MTLDERISKLLGAGTLTVDLVVGAESDGVWVAIKLGDGQRFGGRTFSEAVELAVTLGERHEKEDAPS
jgi:hypothetical protein